MTLCVYFPESHPYLCVTVFSVFKRVPVTGDRKVGGRRARRRKNLTLRTRSLASMRRQCPAFVPLSTSICSQRENEQKPWITWQHKGQQLCKSIHRWNSSPKGKGIIYKIGMVTLKEGQRNLCRRKKWSRTKTSSNVEKGKHKNCEAALKLEGKKGCQLTRKSLVLRHKVWTTSARSALLGSSLREKADTTTLNCTWGPRRGMWQTCHHPLPRAQWSSSSLNFFCCLLSSNIQCWVAELRSVFHLPNSTFSILYTLPLALGDTGRNCLKKTPGTYCSP